MFRQESTAGSAAFWSVLPTADSDDDDILSPRDSLRPDRLRWVAANVVPMIKFFEDLFFHRPEFRHLSFYEFRTAPTARNVFRSGDRLNRVGYFASRLNRCLIPYESSLERDACAIFEAKPNVLEYVSQPTGVLIRINGRARTLYPDFLVKSQTGPAWIDIKYAKDVGSARFIERRMALDEVAADEGLNYQVLTELEIRTELLSNAKWLLSLSNGQVDEGMVAMTRYWMEQRKHIPTFGQVVHELSLYPSALAVVAGFVLDGNTHINLSKPMRDQLVTPNFQDA